MKEIRAAGGVIVRRGEVLLVHRPKYGDWTFPKGKAKPNETDEECALREVEEETGLRCRLGRELPTTRYRAPVGPKRVRYWELTPLGGEFKASKEVDEIRWLSPARAAGLLSYRRDVDLLEALGPAPLVIVRHASAGDRDAWDRDDRLRPLDERGRGQAAELVDRLDAAAVTRVVSSPFRRCVQTVEPLAAERGLAVATTDELGDGVGPERARRFLEQLAPGTVACGHGEELEGLFGRMRKGEAWLVEPGALRPLERLSALAAA